MKEKKNRISFIMSRTKDPKSIDSAIQRHLKAQPAGWVFTPDVFLDLGSRQAVDTVLSRLTSGGQVRRLARGLYDRPRCHPTLGLLDPTVEAVGEALKGRDAIRLQPSGAYAAHLLGLTDQVPMRVVYLTDGPSRQVRVGSREITLKRTTPRNMALAGRISGTMSQALRWLGKEHVSEETVAALQARLSDEDRQMLMADIRYVPAWVGEVFRAIAQEGGE